MADKDRGNAAADINPDFATLTKETRIDGCIFFSRVPNFFVFDGPLNIGSFRCKSRTKAEFKGMDDFYQNFNFLLEIQITDIHNMKFSILIAYSPLRKENKDPEKVVEERPNPFVDWKQLIADMRTTLLRAINLLDDSLAAIEVNSSIDDSIIIRESTDFSKLAPIWAYGLKNSVHLPHGCVFTFVLYKFGQSQLKSTFEKLLHERVYIHYLEGCVIHFAIDISFQNHIVWFNTANVEGCMRKRTLQKSSGISKWKIGLKKGCGNLRCKYPMNTVVCPITDVTCYTRIFTEIHRNKKNLFAGFNLTSFICNRYMPILVQHAVCKSDTMDSLLKSISLKNKILNSATLQSTVPARIEVVIGGRFGRSPKFTGSETFCYVLSMMEAQVQNFLKDNNFYSELNFNLEPTVKFKAVLDEWIPFFAETIEHIKGSVYQLIENRRSFYYADVNPTILTTLDQFIAFRSCEIILTAIFRGTLVCDNFWRTYLGINDINQGKNELCQGWLFKNLVKDDRMKSLVLTAINFNPKIERFYGSLLVTRAPEYFSELIKACQTLKTFRTNESGEVLTLQAQDRALYKLYLKNVCEKAADVFTSLCFANFKNVAGNPEFVISLKTMNYLAVNLKKSVIINSDQLVTDLLNTNIKASSWLSPFKALQSMLQNVFSCYLLNPLHGNKGFVEALNDKMIAEGYPFVLSGLENEYIMYTQSRNACIIVPAYYQKTFGKHIQDKNAIVSNFNSCWKIACLHHLGPIQFSRHYLEWKGLEFTLQVFWELTERDEPRLTKGTFSRTCIAANEFHTTKNIKPMFRVHNVPNNIKKRVLYGQLINGKYQYTVPTNDALEKNVLSSPHDSDEENQCISEEACSVEAEKRLLYSGRGSKRRMRDPVTGKFKSSRSIEKYEEDNVSNTSSMDSVIDKNIPRPENRDSMQTIPGSDYERLLRQFDEIDESDDNFCVPNSTLCMREQGFVGCSDENRDFYYPKVYKPDLKDAQDNEMMAAGVVDTFLLGILRRETHKNVVLILADSFNKKSGLWSVIPHREEIIQEAKVEAPEKVAAVIGIEDHFFLLVAVVGTSEILEYNSFFNYRRESADEAYRLFVTFLNEFAEEAWPKQSIKINCPQQTEIIDAPNLCGAAVCYFAEQIIRENDPVKVPDSPWEYNTFRKQMLQFIQEKHGFI